MYLIHGSKLCLIFLRSILLILNTHVAIRVCFVHIYSKTKLRSAVSISVIQKIKTCAANASRKSVFKLKYSQTATYSSDIWITQIDTGDLSLTENN